MFEFITGDLVSLGEDYAVIETGGIGYRLKVPASSVSAIRESQSATSERLQGGGSVRLFTVSRLRDEVFHLFGFVTAEERAIFERVCGVTGVGPAIGMAILSGIPIDQFRAAVLTDQPKVLERIKGVGKKTAQRLVLELKDVIAADGGPAVLPERAPVNSIARDAISALLAIGFNSAEAEASISREQRANPDASVEQLIRSAM